MPLASPLAAELLPDLSEDERGDHWHLVTEDGEDLTGGKGGVALLELLPATRLVGRTLRVTHLHWLAGIGDFALDKLRGRLGRFVPEGPGPERFP